MPKEEKQNWLTKIVERKPSLYWWILLNISMACVAVISWLYFVPTFSSPETAKHYERMIWLGRPPGLPAFDAASAPKGTTIDPELAHQIFNSNELNDQDIAELNIRFLRNYIQGIKIEKLNYYLKGKFEVSQCRPLGKEDMFQTGIVVQAQALRDLGNSKSPVPFLVSIEYILPGADHSHLDYFAKGVQFQLHKIPNFCSIIHVKKYLDETGETNVKITLAPLVTLPPLHLSSAKTIQVSTPARIFPEKPLPIFKD